MARVIFVICFLLIATNSWSQGLSVGIKGGYCKYLAIDNTPFYQLTPREGYPGRFCGEAVIRTESSKWLCAEFGLTKIANSYHTPFQSDHGIYTYRASQDLFLANASVQAKISCPSLKNIYGYIGPSFAIGVASIRESGYPKGFSGFALVPGISQGVVCKMTDRLSMTASLDARYLLAYNESLEMGSLLDRNTLLFGQIGLFYSMN